MKITIVIPDKDIASLVKIVVPIASEAAQKLIDEQQSKFKKEMSAMMRPGGGPEIR